MCPKCGKSEFLDKKVKTRDSPRPWRRAQGKEEVVHGLLGCTNPECIEQAWTHRFWNRDVLATCNMINIVQSMLSGEGSSAEAPPTQPFRVG